MAPTSNNQLINLSLSYLTWYLSSHNDSTTMATVQRYRTRLTWLNITRSLSIRRYSVNNETFTTVLHVRNHEISKPNWTYSEVVLVLRTGTLKGWPFGEEGDMLEWQPSEPSWGGLHTGLFSMFCLWSGSLISYNSQILQIITANCSAINGSVIESQYINEIRI